MVWEVLGSEGVLVVERRVVSRARRGLRLGEDMLVLEDKEAEVWEERPLQAMDELAVLEREELGGRGARRGLVESGEDWVEQAGDGLWQDVVI